MNLSPIPFCLFLSQRSYIKQMTSFRRELKTIRNSEKMPVLKYPDVSFYLLSLIFSILELKLQLRNLSNVVAYLGPSVFSGRFNEQNCFMNYF